MATQVTDALRVRAEVALVRLTTLRDGKGQPLGDYSRHVIAAVVIDAYERFGDDPARILTALQRARKLGQLAGVTPDDDGTLVTIRDAVLYPIRNP